MPEEVDANAWVGALRRFERQGRRLHVDVHGKRDVEGEGDADIGVGAVREVLGEEAADSVAAARDTEGICSSPPPLSRYLASTPPAPLRVVRPTPPGRLMPNRICWLLTARPKMAIQENAVSHFSGK